MTLSTFSRAAAAATLLASTASAAFSASSTSNVAMYWGQGYAQIDLSVVCADPSIDVVNVAFVDGFPQKVGDYPKTNFANACGNYYQHPTDPTQDNKLLTCPTIGTGIKTCQQNGKKVLLSLGGGYPTDYYLPSQEVAKYFAQFLIGAFGPSDSTWTGPRPFGDASVDGFDLDLEATADSVPAGGISANYAYFVNQLKAIKSSLLISTAPQCQVPDPRVADAISKAPFDMIFTQFYNTDECSAKLGYQQLGSASTGFTFQKWADWLKANSYNKNVKLYIGLPAGTDGVPSNPDHYLKPDEANALITKFKSSDMFGGIMLWEATVNVKNVVNCHSYSYWMKAALAGTFTSSYKACVSSSSSMLPSSTKTSSTIVSTTASTTSAAVSPTATVKTPDGTCGDKKNGIAYSCSGYNFGNCCSAYGYCGGGPSAPGLRSDYCGTGCNPLYGDCDGLTSTVKTSTVSATSTSSAVSSASSSKVSSVSSSKISSASSSQVSSASSTSKAASSSSTSQATSSSSSKAASSSSSSQAAYSTLTSKAVSSSSSSQAASSSSSSKAASSSSSSQAASSSSTSKAASSSSSSQAASSSSTSKAASSSSSSQAASSSTSKAASVSASSQSVSASSSSNGASSSATPSKSASSSSASVSSASVYASSSASVYVSSTASAASSSVLVYSASTPAASSSASHSVASSSVAVVSSSSVAYPFGSVIYSQYYSPTPSVSAGYPSSTASVVYPLGTTKSVYPHSSSDLVYPSQSSSVQYQYSNASTPCTTSTKVPTSTAPVYGAESTPGYPVYGASSSVTPGYPVYGASSSSVPGYPVYGASSSATPGYPAYGASSSATPGYPVYGASSSSVPGYPSYDTPSSSAGNGYDSYPTPSTVKGYGGESPSVTSAAGYDYPSYPASSSTTKVITTTYVDSCETGVTTKTETITQTVCNQCKGDSVTSVYVCNQCGPSVVTYTITKPNTPATNVPSVPSSSAKPNTPVTNVPSVPSSSAKPSTPPTYNSDKPSTLAKSSSSSSPPTYSSDMPKKQEVPATSTTVQIVYLTKTPVPVVESATYTPIAYSAPAQNGTSSYAVQATGTGSVPSKATGYGAPQFTGAASHVSVGVSGVLAVVAGLLVL